MPEFQRITRKCQGNCSKRKLCLFLHFRVNSQTLILFWVPFILKMDPEGEKSDLPSSELSFDNLFITNQYFIQRFYMCPERDSNLGPSRIAVFQDWKATALITQPPRLDDSQTLVDHFPELMMWQIQIFAQFESASSTDYKETLRRRKAKKYMSPDFTKN